MKLLQVIGTLDPAYGGPVEALHQMTLALSELGHNLTTATLDGPDAPYPISFPGKVHTFGPSTGRYRYSHRLAPWLKQKIHNFDAVITYGIWQYQSLAVSRAAPRAGVPYFVFPHGALDPWSVKSISTKYAKKWLYWNFVEYNVLRNASAVLFRSKEEAAMSRLSFRNYFVKEEIVDNGIRRPPENHMIQCNTFYDAFPNLRKKRKIIFLGRVDPKKGCDLLIKALSHVIPADNRLHLIISGPYNNTYKSYLEKLIIDNELQSNVTWTGMLSKDLKWGAFRTSDVFILPSHQENFGISVVEALACGVPVLISDKVNIWRRVVDSGAGFAESDTVGGTRRLLERWIAQSTEQAKEMRVRARDCFENHFEIQQAALKLVSVVAHTQNVQRRYSPDSAAL